MEIFNKTSTLVTEKILQWFEFLIVMLPNFVVAIIVLCLFIGLGKLATKLTAKTIKHISRSKQLQNLFQKIVFWSFIFTGLSIALGVLNLDKTVTSLLAGVGVVGLALGFAFQDIAANFMSGILLCFHSPFKIGDNIETTDTFGKVKHITLRSTVIQTFDGKIITIPNKMVFQDKLINYTKNKKRRVEFEVGVAYDTDLDHAEKIAKKALKQFNESEDHDVEILYHTFDASSINFTARFWMKHNSQFDFLTAKSNAIKAIKKAYEKEKIDIPFPIQTVLLKKQ